MTISSKHRGAWGELADPRTKGDWAKLYVGSALGAARSNPRFEDLRHFSFFIGYARSGHTLVASMLNAHPEVVIANELDAVRFVRHRFLRRSCTGSYSSETSGSDPQIERGPGTSTRFPGSSKVGSNDSGCWATRGPGRRSSRSPRIRACLDRLRRRVGVPIRVVHVTRNPFDNIATEARRHKMTLGQCHGVVRADLPGGRRRSTAARRVRAGRPPLRDLRRTSRSRPRRPVPVHRGGAGRRIPRGLCRNRMAQYQPQPRCRRVDRQRPGGCRAADRQVRDPSVVLLRRLGPAGSFDDQGPPAGSVRTGAEGLHPRDPRSPAVARSASLRRWRRARRLSSQS